MSDDDDDDSFLRWTNPFKRVGLFDNSGQWPEFYDQWLGLWVCDPLRSMTTPPAIRAHIAAGMKREVEETMDASERAWFDDSDIVACVKLSVAAREKAVLACRFGLTQFRPVVRALDREHDRLLAGVLELLRLRGVTPQDIR